MGDPKAINPKVATSSLTSSLRRSSLNQSPMSAGPVANVPLEVFKLTLIHVYISTCVYSGLVFGTFESIFSHLIGV